MRPKTTAAFAALTLLGSLSGATACDRLLADCLPRTVTWPSYTSGGAYLGVVEAPVRLQPRLPVSRDTGQPLTVLYGNPSSRPGTVASYLHLEALPRTRRSDTVGAYPVGY